MIKRSNMKLTVKEWIMKSLGYGYIANPKSKEIHRLETKHKNCRVEMMRRKRYITKKKAYELINMNPSSNGWNGCRYCFPEKDLG